MEEDVLELGRQVRLECLWHFWEDLLQDLLQEQNWLDTSLATGVVVVVGPLSSLLMKISAQNQKNSIFIM